MGVRQLRLGLARSNMIALSGGKKFNVTSSIYDQERDRFSDYEVKWCIKKERSLVIANHLNLRRLRTMTLLAGIKEQLFDASHLYVSFLLHDCIYYPKQ